MTRRQQQHAKRRNKKRPPAASRAAEPPRSGAPQPLKEEVEQQHVGGSDVLYTLMEAFDSISLHEAEEAYKEANGDVNRAAEILANLSDGGVDDDPSTSSVSSGGFSFSDSGNGNGSSSSSSGSSLTSESSGSSEGLRKGGNKQKKVVAVAGTVSTVLGKDYVKAASPRRDLVRGTAMKGLGHGGSMVVKEEEAEEFLFSMLGDDCELNMGVVRDVLCQCGFDIEKALEILLGLSASSDEQSEHSRSFNNATDYREDTTRLSDHGNLADCTSDCTSHSSECDDNFWGYACRDYLNALTGLESTSATGPRSNESDIPQKVLESLFNIPVSSEHEPSTMNWKNVVKKMQSLGPGVGVFQSSDAISHQNSYAKGNEYHLLRGPAKEQWDTRNSYLRKAATAYSNGNREYAAYLSDQGRRKTKVAEAADLRASQNIFEARNKNIENVVTIDLHGQHVKPAMKLLKLHLLFGTYVRSIQTLRVITGCGSHSRVGKSKLKQSVVKLLVDEGVEWREENVGVVLIKVDGSKQYSFMDADSDDDE